MLAIAVELLGGRYVATAYNDRNAAEWPPHPARLFSALVATWAEDAIDGVADEGELDALRWLESQAPPEILASASHDVGRRRVAPVFVPVNDVSVVSYPSRTKLTEAEALLELTTDAKERAKIEKTIAKHAKKFAEDTAKAVAAVDKFSKDDLKPPLRILPESRSKQPRTFPSITPALPRFVFIWSDALPAANLLTALDRLLLRVVRIGHSSSLVALRRVGADAIPGTTHGLQSFAPSVEGGDHVLRWVGKGQVDRLRHAFERHKETEPRVLPAKFVRYSEGAIVRGDPVATSVFDPEFLVFARVGGPRLPLTSTAGVAKQLRRALMSVAQEPIVEALSGHRPDGAATTAPHLAFVPLPYVGHEHADGTILGVALAFPRAISPEDRRAIHAAIGRLESARDVMGDDDVAEILLHMGAAGSLELQRVAWGEHPRKTLRSSTWTRAARHWVSVTPVALDHNPGDLHDRDPARRSAAFALAQDSIRKSVLRIGLPEPVGIDVVRSTVAAGSVKPRSFPRFPADAGKVQRVLVHVRLTFARPVAGPLLLGAGRYFGLGLCLPVGDFNDVALPRTAPTDGADGVP